MYKRNKVFVFLMLLALMALWNCQKTDPQPNSNANSAAAGLNAGSATASAGPIEYAAPTREPRKFALLVGINTYRYPQQVSPLAGCENDAENMQALVTGKFDFKAGDIKILKSAQATHEEIVKAFQDHLIAQAQQDDIVVFHYSGHGSQMKDVSGDEIDGLDETLVCHDSRDPAGKVFDVSDDEINGLLKQLSQKTKNITLIFDSCHSGTVSRDVSGLAREAPKDKRQPPATPPAYALSERGMEDESDLRLKNVNYVLIAGCLSIEKSFELRENGKEYGTLTYYLVEALKNAGAKATYRDVMDKVRSRVSTKYPNQHPQLEGAAADHYVFSDSTSLAQAYILASPRDNNTVTLQAGAVQGLTAGSIFDLYDPETKDFGPKQKPVAQVQLTSVAAFTSEGTRTGKPIQPASRAVEREHQYPDLKLMIYYQGLSPSAKLRAIKAKLDQYKFIQAVAEPRGYHLLLRQDGQQIVTEGGSATELSPRVSINDPAVVDTVVSQVKQWTKWFNVLSINNPGSADKINLTIKVVDDRGVSRDPFANLGKAEDTLRVGEQFQFTVTNKSTRDFYISILGLSTDGSVSVLYPFEPGANELLKAETSLTTEAYRATLSQSRPDLKSITDAIKVFATSKPVDFHSLVRPAVAGEVKGGTRGFDDPLEQLLGQAALSLSRGAEPVRIALGDWATVSRVYMVKQ